MTQNILYKTERKTRKERWVGALKEYAVSNHFLLINGPADSVSGQHLGEAVLERVEDSKVIFLHEDTGHRPQLEAPEATMKAFFEYHDCEAVADRIRYTLSSPDYYAVIACALCQE